MDNGPGGGISAERLQEALRAFGTQPGTAPPSTAEMAALVQRMGLPPGTALTAQGQPAPVAKATGPQFLCIILGDIEFGWEAARVTGVERLSDITPVPLTKPWVLGVANLRGAITSVVDLRLFLGLPRQFPTARSRVVVANANGMTIGFMVDGVNEIRPIPPETVTSDAIRQIVPPWLAPFADGVTAIGTRRVVLMSVERLLFADTLHHYRVDSA